MEYKGKLYGKVGNHTFPLLHTTDDWEKMEKQIKELKAENEALKQANGVSTDSRQLTKPVVTNHVCRTCKGTRLVYIDEKIGNTLCPDC